MDVKSGFFVDDNAIKYREDQRGWYWDRVVITKEVFIEAYNKWINVNSNIFDNPFACQDDADDWCDD